MIKLCCEYLSVRCIWLFVIIMSRTRFRVNLHSIVAWMSRNSFLETGAISEVYFKRRKCLRKKLLRFLRVLENTQKFIPAKSKVNSESQKFFPAKCSSFAEPQKFIPIKCLFPKKNVLNTSSQWKSLEFRDDLEI